MGAGEKKFGFGALDRSDRVSGREGNFARVRRSRERMQVAAVCYRIGAKGIEFLLVQTRRSGRWTFPKGGAEPGLTHAQAAALEAVEEAGVHGRMEQASFARYVRFRGDRRRNFRPAGLTTNAYLCEVLWLDSPEESGRNPTWFCPEKAKRRLMENRSADFASAIGRVIDRAVARVHRLHSSAANPQDALQKVQFEAFEGTTGHACLQHAALSQYSPRSLRRMPRSAAIELAVHAQLSKVLRFVPPQSSQQARSFRGGDAVQQFAEDAGGPQRQLPMISEPTSPEGLPAGVLPKRRSGVRKEAARSRE
ncbi:MAG TPA: NUDIX domain-containing protein [Candidatus Aquilonibacter sp.]|nr:NUDIX domain-containing protein [Candidatus Aquilonibacter sp.]